MPKLSRVAALVVVVAFALTTSLAGHAKTEGVRPARATRTAVSSAASMDRSARGVASSEPVRLHHEGSAMLAFPPAPTSTKPRAILYLHGAHGVPGKGCPWMRAGAADHGWLVCPEGPVAEPGEHFSWGADLRAHKAVVERATRAAVREGASTDLPIAVGFSQGSYVALDLIKTRLGRFHALVLLGAEVHPSVESLREAGVVRVALGAGSLDGAHASMREEAARLASEGLDARFFDLGRVGHTYAADDKDALTDAIAWASRDAS